MSDDATPTRRLEQRPLIIVAWTWVAVPFGYGIYQLLHKIHALFSS